MILAARIFAGLIVGGALGSPFRWPFGLILGATLGAAFAF